MDAVYMSDKNISSIPSNETYTQPLEALDAPMRHFLVFVFTVTAVLAFTGNVMVIVVECLGTRSAKTLRKFLINLAISDILLGVVCVPFTYTDFMLGQWIFASWLCPLSQFVQILSVFVTTFTLTVIGIERYLVIVYPMEDLNRWIKQRCGIILIMGWILGSLVSWYPTSKRTTVQFLWNGQTYWDCHGDYSDPLLPKLYTTSVFVVTFAIPLVIQIYCYVSIARRLTEFNDSVENSNGIKLSRSRSVLNDRRKTIKMLLVVVIAFAFCWLPIKTFTLLIFFWPGLMDLKDDFSYYRYVGTYFICYWIAMANSFVNPIIYSFMSSSFRVIKTYKLV